MNTHSKHAAAVDLGHARPAVASLFQPKPKPEPPLIYHFYLCDRIAVLQVLRCSVEKTLSCHHCCPFAFILYRTTIAMADYEMEKDVYELNFESSRLAREACDEATAKDPTRPRFVMGSLGPTNRTGSISPVSV